MELMAANPQRFAAFVAYAGTNAQSSPVGFLEGLYVVPDARRRGMARALVAEVGRWTRDCGCNELASDTALANAASHAVHRSLGFEETERVVFFRKLV